MNRAWDAVCASHTQKLVLIALADNANDDGGCWPSLTTIARRCCMSRQGILNQIAAFETDGWLTVDRASGKVNQYTLAIPDQSTALTSQPVGLVNPVDGDQSTALTGPVHPVDTNHKEPSEEPKDDILESDEFQKIWNEFKQHRRKLRKPLTPKAESLILSKLKQQPARAIKALEIVIEKGWQSFEWEWFNNKSNHEHKKPSQRTEADRDFDRTGIRSNAGDALKLL